MKVGGSVCLFLPSGPAGISRGIQSVNALTTHQLKPVIGLHFFPLFVTLTGKMEACMVKPEVKKKSQPVRTFTVDTKTLN